MNGGAGVKGGGGIGCVKRMEREWKRPGRDGSSWSRFCEELRPKRTLFHARLVLFDCDSQIAMAADFSYILLA